MKTLRKPRIYPHSKLITPKLLVVFSFVLVFFSGVHAVQASSLYFTPTSGTHQVGQIFTVGVYVDSAEQAMNAASGIISFPADKLEITSLSKAGSIFTLWVQEPSLENGVGSARFEGVVLNPGYQGSTGKLLTIHFKAKALGDAPVLFTTGSVLANDGKGTNILSSLGSARFSIGVPLEGPVAEEATTPAVSVGVPPAPKVTSVTHLDPNRWYAKDDVTFSWVMPKDITGVNVLADRHPDTNPGTRSDGVFSSYSYEDVEEGTWYFHIRLRSAAGWGAIAHFRFQIDVTPPEPFKIMPPGGKQTDDPQPSIVFETIDAVSGMAYYRVRVGDGEPVQVLPAEVVGRKPYRLPAQEPGRHTLVVQAYDHAGNVTVASEEFTVISISPPALTEYAEELAEGDILKIAGTTYPNAAVRIFLRNEAGKIETTKVSSDPEGRFLTTWPSRLKAGIYALSAQVRDARGAESIPSPERTLLVRQRAVLRIGSLVVSYLSVFTGLLGILLLLTAFFIYAWYRFVLFRTHLRKEVHEAEEMLHSAFDLLRKDFERQLKILEKVQKRRALTEKEKGASERLRKDLDRLEKLVRQEIEDIEKEVK